MVWVRPDAGLLEHGACSTPLHCAACTNPTNQIHSPLRPPIGPPFACPQRGSPLFWVATSTTLLLSSSPQWRSISCSATTCYFWSFSLFYIWYNPILHLTRSTNRIQDSMIDDLVDATAVSMARGPMTVLPSKLAPGAAQWDWVALSRHIQACHRSFGFYGLSRFWLMATIIKYMGESWWRTDSMWEKCSASKWKDMQAQEKALYHHGSDHIYSTIICCYWWCVWLPCTDV